MPHPLGAQSALALALEAVLPPALNAIFDSKRLVWSLPHTGQTAVCTAVIGIFFSKVVRQSLHLKSYFGIFNG